MATVEKAQSSSSAEDHTVGSISKTSNTLGGSVAARSESSSATAPVEASSPELDSSSLPDPPQAVLDAIEALRKHPENLPSLAPPAIQLSIEFLANIQRTHNGKVHWFRHDKYLPIATQSLLVFSYKSWKGFDDFTFVLSKQLESCHRCVRAYHNSMLELVSFLRKDTNVPGSSVDKFSIGVEQWDIERLLNPVISAATKDISTKSAKQLAVEQTALFECLCRPQLFLHSQALRNNFEKAFFQGHMRFKLPDLVPGAIFFLFDQNDISHKWALEFLSNLFSSTSLLTEDSIDLSLITIFSEETSKILTILLDDEKLQRHWLYVWMLLKCLDASAIVRLTGTDPEKTVFQLLMASLGRFPNLALPSVLRIMKLFFERFGSALWPLLYPHNPSTILTQLFLGNPYALNLIRSNSAPRAALQKGLDQFNIGDYVSWIDPFLRSCDSTDLAKCSTAIAQFLFKNHMGMPDIAKTAMLAASLQSIATCMRTKPSKKLPLVSEVEALLRQNMRSFCYSNAAHIVKLSQTGPEFLRIEAVEVIGCCISFDTVVGVPDSAVESSVRENFVAQLSQLPPGCSPCALWDSLNEHGVFDADIARMVLISARYAPVITHPLLKDNTVYCPKGILALSTVKSLTQSLKLISDMTPRVLKENVLTQPEVLISVFVALFSADNNISQASADILCQAFDADDRLQAIQKLFIFNLPAALRSFSAAVDLVAALALFSCCPKLIKISQDVLTCLFSASSGVLNSESTKHEKNDYLLQYWKSNWIFLKMTFPQIMIWQAKFSKSLMIDFLRDMLDYSGELLSNFRTLESVLDRSSEASMEVSQNGKDLLIPAVDSLLNMSTMLRLRDQVLTQLCFDNINTLTELMKSFDVPLSDDLKEKFLKLAKRGSGYQNLLSLDQRTKLLVIIGSYTEEEATFSLLPPNREGESASPTVTTSTISTSTDSSTVGRNSQGQTSITNFTRPSSGLPRSFLPPQPKAPIQTSGAPATGKLMETLKQSIRENRSHLPVAPITASKPVSQLVVHPARPPGFNSKSFSASSSDPSPAVDVDASSSDDASDGNSSDDGLFTAPKGNAKVKTVKGRKEITSSISVAPGIQTIRRELSEKQKEERNLRMCLNVNTDSLHTKILTWNYHWRGDFPDNKTSKDYTPVPESFVSVKQYREVMEPLLLLECWESIRNNKEESQEVPFIVKSGSRSSIDQFHELNAAAEKESFENSNVSEADLIVLTYYPDDDGLKARMPSDGAIQCLARIQEVKRSVEGYVDLKLKVHMPGQILRFLEPNHTFHVLRVMRYVKILTIIGQY